MFGIAQRADQLGLGDVVLVDAGDVLLARARHGVLRAHELDRAGDAGAESILGLRQLFARQRFPAPGERHRGFGRADVEQRGPHFELDARFEIGQLGLPLFELRIGLCRARLGTAAFEDRHVHGRGDRVRALGGTGSETKERRSRHRPAGWADCCRSRRGAWLARPRRARARAGDRRDVPWRPRRRPRSRSPAPA